MRGGTQQKCPFCRKTLPKTKEENNEQVMKRFEANDQDAISDRGMVYNIENQFTF